MISLLMRWPLWLFLQGAIFAAFYYLAYRNGGELRSPPGAIIPPSAIGNQPLPMKPPPLTGIRAAKASPDTANAFEKKLDSLLASGDFLDARDLVFSQQDRNEANRALGRRLAHYLHDLEAIRLILQDIPPMDRYSICSSLLRSADKPFELLRTLQDVFPRGMHLKMMLESYVRLSSESQTPEILEFVNTMPDSPMRQSLMLEVLMKRGFEGEFKEVASIEKALTLLAGNKARARYVLALQQSTFFRGLDEAGKARYAQLLEEYSSAAPNR